MWAHPSGSTRGWVHASGACSLFEPFWGYTSVARSSAGPGVKVADRERNQKNKGSIDRALTLPVVRVEPRHGPDLLRISELVAVRPARDQVEADRQMHVGFGLSGAFPCGQRQSRFSGGEKSHCHRSLEGEAGTVGTARSSSNRIW